MECVKCKAQIPEGSVFCNICGRKQVADKRKKKKRANGTGTVYKLPGNRAKPWVAARDGMYIESFRTQADAEKCLARYVDIDINEKFNMTFEDVYKKWEPIHRREVSGSQMGTYSSSYKHCAALHKKKFRSLRKSDFMNVIMEAEDNGYSKSTCEKIIQLFGQLSTWALDEGIITRDHSTGVRTVAEQKRDGLPFTAEEVRAISESKNEAAKIVLILIGCGARPNEFFKVRLEDCEDTYFISGSKNKKGKPVDQRVIAVSEIGLEAYQSILASAREKGCDKLIGGYTGNRTPKNFQKRDFANLMEELGIKDHVPYDCRHTFTTMAVRAGVTPNVLAKVMGHKGINTADKHYVHLNKDDAIAAVSKIKKDGIFKAK